MHSNQHKRKAIGAFVAWCAAFGSISFISLARKIYLILNHQDHTQLPFSEPVMILLIFGVVIISAVIMRYVFVQSQKARLTWLRIVSKILQIIYWAMLPVGAIGLLLGTMAE